MPLLYDSFGVRRVAIEVNLWPDIDKFKQGDLGKLFAAVNGDEIFSSCELRPEAGLLLTGEGWTYELTTTSLFIRSTKFMTPETLRSRIRELLSDTRKYIAPKVAYYTDEVRVFGGVPEGGKRDVAQSLRKRLLRGKTDPSDLPGLEGAGLSLSGITDSYYWRGEINPMDEDSLLLTGRLQFFPDAEPPKPGPDLDVIDAQIDEAYDFVKEHLRTFSSKFIK